MKRRNVILVLFSFLLVGLWSGWEPTAEAADVLQWRNHRDGVYPETGLLKSWPEGGPKILWQIDDAGGGYASPIVVKGKVFLTGITGKNEFITCYDLSGKQLWRTEYGEGWTQSYPETRTTPTYVDGKLFVISGAGVAAAVEAETGKLLWKSEVWAKYQGSFGNWGAAESPLVVDGKVICTPTGEQTTMVALKTEDGTPIWKTPSLQDDGAYVSPILIEHQGKRQIVGVTARHIFGVDPANGHLIWKFDYLGTTFDNGGNPDRWVINCNTPLYKDGRIFVTSGYDHAGVMLQLNSDATQVSLAWKTDVLDTHHGHVVLVDGYLYGSNWLSNSAGNWVCLEWETGKKMYEAEWNNKGPIIAADGMLFCYEEKRGTLGLVPATPNEFKVTSSFRIVQGEKSHWSHPVISDGIMYLRRGPALMAYDVRAAVKKE